MSDTAPHRLTTPPNRTGLVLTGGGARGAYQVGALQGVNKIAADFGQNATYSILTGVSAGAINAAYLAAFADDFTRALHRLKMFWSHLHSEAVFRTDLGSIGKISWQWMADVATGGSGGRHFAQALLDTAPLANLIREHIPFGRIAANLNAAILKGVAVSATDYDSTENVTFFMANDDATESWQRAARVGVRAAITEVHIMASAAIPILFPPVEIGGRYFGDGCMRHSAPLSAALHLGADKLLVVGVRKGRPTSIDGPGFLDGTKTNRPSLARTASVVINAVLLESVETDIERLTRINQTLDLVATPQRTLTALRKVDCLYLHPSEDLGAIAAEEMSALPKVMRYLLRGLGPREEAADIASYLFFEPAYCHRLMELGYRDALARRDEIEDFLTGGTAGGGGAQTLPPRTFFPAEERHI